MVVRVNGISVSLDGSPPVLIKVSRIRSASAASDCTIGSSPLACSTR